MFVNAINTANVVFSQNSIKKSKEVTNPITAVSKEPKVSADAALKSYFLGGQAVAFKGFGCSTSDFAIKKLDDVPCCCCGDRMIRGEEIPNVVRSFTALKGEKLADKIDKDKDYFRASQRVVATLMADEARKNNSLGVSGAFAKAKQNLPEKVQNYCINVLNEVSEAAKTAYGKDENPMSKVVEQEIKKVQSGKIERIPFTEKLEALKGDLSLEQYETVLDKAMNIPEGYKSVEKLFNKKKGNDSDSGIMNNLLKGALHTAEHVHPKSLGGPNATSNYLGECALCNNPRGSMSYAQWLKVHPEYPIKVQSHIEYVEQKIVDGEIPASYDSYPVDINKTLTKESNGVMTLKVLNPETIKELRERKQAGEDVNVSEVTAEIYGEDKEEKTEEAA